MTVGQIGKFLAPRELAERWSMSRESLANMRYMGKGPNYLKLGARVLYPLADVESYEAARLVRCAS